MREKNCFYFSSICSFFFWGVGATGVSIFERLTNSLWVIYLNCNFYNLNSKVFRVFVDVSLLNHIKFLVFFI